MLILSPLSGGVLTGRRGSSFAQAPPGHGDRRTRGCGPCRRVRKGPLGLDQEHHHDDQRDEENRIETPRDHHEFLVGSQLVDLVLQVLQDGVVGAVDVVQRLSDRVHLPGRASQSGQVVGHGGVVGVPRLQPVVNLDETLVLDGLDVVVNLGIHEVVVPAVVSVWDDGDFLGWGVDERGGPGGRDGGGAPRVEFTVDDEDVVTDDVPAFELTVERVDGLGEVVCGVSSIGEREVVGALALSVFGGDFTGDDRGRVAWVAD